jgi:REP element-mobilizing transposase RayT
MRRIFRPRPRQLGFTFRNWGGARKGAGRPPNGETAGVSHLRRPVLASRHPVHVTLRAAKAPSLRGTAMFRTVRAALAGARDRFGFRLVHFSVQRDHLHLIVEAEDSRALSRGMQGLSIRVAKALNRRLQRHGRVFADRYHARALKTPRETQRALRYVLCNARKHGSLSSPAGYVDGCSSAPWFSGWSRPRELAFVREACPKAPAPPVVPPRTWLLRTGWQRAGPIDVDDVPGAR